jgi:hypothetical protein
MKPAFFVNIDREIYDDSIISKAVYWHTANFVIERVANANLETGTYQIYTINKPVTNF